MAEALQEKESTLRLLLNVGGGGGEFVRGQGSKIV